MSYLSNSFLDELIGPLQTDTITTFFGPPGAGKSTVAFQYMISCLNDNKKVIYIDTEGGFSAERLKQMDSSINLQDILVFSPKNFEEQQKTFFAIAKDLESLGEIGLIVVDSLVMLYRLKLGDNPQGINKDMAEQLRLLTELSRAKSIPVITINQMYTHFETKEKKMVGGSTIEYWSKTVILLDKENDRRYAQLRKHKFKPEGQEVGYTINDKGLISS